MRKLTKLMAGVLSATMLFGTVGCGGRDLGNKDIGRGENDYAEGVTVAEKGKAVYVGSKEGKTRLKVAFVDAGFGSEWLRVITTHFVKENPEYWVYLDGDPALTTIVSTQLSAGVNLSDIYMPLAHDWWLYAQNGWLEDLSDVYDAKADGEGGKTVYEKMIPIWQDYCETEGPQGSGRGKYAYPWSLGVSGIVYNGTMFEKYGWEVPETIPELAELCEKIKKDTNGSVAPFVYPGISGGYWDFMGMTNWMQSTGIEGLEKFYDFDSVEVYNPDRQPGKGKYEALQAFETIFAHEKGNELKGSMSKNAQESQICFLRQEAAMIINASWMETEMINDIPEDMNIRFMRFPYLETAQKKDGEYVKVNYATTPDFMIIPKAIPDEQKQAAKKFLIHLSTDESLRYFTKYTSSLRPFDYDISSVKNELSDFARDVVDIAFTSESWFPRRSKKWAISGFPTWYPTYPYSNLIFGLDNGGTTAERFCKAEYQYARGQWDTWLNNSTP